MLSCWFPGTQPIVLVLATSIRAVEGSTLKGVLQFWDKPSKEATLRIKDSYEWTGLEGLKMAALTQVLCDEWCPLRFLVSGMGARVICQDDSRRFFLLVSF